MWMAHWRPWARLLSPSRGRWIKWALASPILLCRRERWVLRREILFRTRRMLVSWRPLVRSWILASLGAARQQWTCVTISIPPPILVYSLLGQSHRGRQQRNKNQPHTDLLSSSRSRGLHPKDAKLGQGTLWRCRPISYFQTGRGKKNEAKGFWCMILRDLQPAILSPVSRQSRVPSPALGGSNCFPRLIPAHYFCSLTRWHHNGACGSRSD